MVDGYSSPHLTGRLNVAGRHITAYLADLLTRRGYSFNRCTTFLCWAGKPCSTKESMQTARSA